ncbi:hypothetical protein ACG7TL_002976 [Trametes sanguinea]
MESGRFRRMRKEFLRKSPPSSNSAEDPVQALFLPDELYDFQEGHFDGVINRYREMHVTSWPEDIPELPPLLERLRQIHPDQDTQTHILHLASDGEILPHVDNIEASGTWILGVSLGDERVLRLEDPSAPEERYEISLPSGSVYLQRDTVRYNYQHSILKKIGGRQRLSIMIRSDAQCRGQRSQSALDGCMEAYKVTFSRISAEDAPYVFVSNKEVSQNPP